MNGNCPARTSARLVAAVCGILAGAPDAHADGGIIDKIYHPYVQPLEHELELRASLENGGGPGIRDRQTWRLGYGTAFSDNWFGEVYLIGQKDSMNNFRLSEYEVEALWQITEQGEYSADWGLLFEYATADSRDSMELSGTLLAETEWRRWTGTANLTAAYEFGGDVANEFETALALQARYRLSMSLEPALEFYSGEDVLGAGPVLMGNHRLGPGRQLHWEGGLILGMSDETPDHTIRLLLEYEF
jgi:hypothetical protein